jgi:hypothetical protein
MATRNLLSPGRALAQSGVHSSSKRGFKGTVDMSVACTSPVPTIKIALLLTLMAFAARANAECAFSVPATSSRACMRDFSPQSFHANRPNGEARSSNDTRRDDNRWETARVLGAASVAGQGDSGHDSAVARSMSELRWADSSDWIRNPPPWLQEIKDSRRRRAPVPVVHLWQSQQTQTLIALGVSHRGQPGVFISRKLPY